jgi:hypothetical protein
MQGDIMKKYTVWFDQINQTLFEVQARSERSARKKAFKAYKQFMKEHIEYLKENVELAIELDET